jgi:GT2 family glycosyltransferase
MSSPSKKVCVVIVTYNGTPWISACLRSLQESTYPAEIVVIDNASTDDTVRIIDVEFPTVSLLRQGQNLGFGKANNVGMVWALGKKADFVFLLNQDTTVNATCIENLMDASMRTTHGVLSPLHWNGAGTDLDQGFKRYVQPHFIEQELDQLKTQHDSNVYEISFVNAAAWFIPVLTLKTIGGFAPLFYHYGEDRDFVNRLQYHGLSIGLVPAAQIKHYRDERNMSVVQWDEKKKMRYYTVGMLARVGNINIGLLSAVLNAVSWTLKESIFLLSKKDWKALFRFGKLLAGLVARSSKISDHRRIVKQNTPLIFLTCVSE